MQQSTLNRNDMSEDIKATCWLVKGFGPPWKVSPIRRPPKILPEEYWGYVSFKSYKLTYRQVEDIVSFLIGKTVDHSSIAWTMQKFLHDLNELVFDLYLYTDSILMLEHTVSILQEFPLIVCEPREIAAEQTKVKQTVIHWRHVLPAARDDFHCSG